MFSELVGSGKRRPGGTGRGVVVAALHGLVIAGAIRVTTAPPVTLEKPKTYDIFIDQPIQPTPPPPVTETTTSDAPVVEGPVIELPAPPVDVPTGLPPITKAPPIDPEQLRRAVIASSLPTGRRGDSVSMSTVLAVTQVDEAAIPIHQPAPRYPPVLQTAGVEGRVMVQFIIDTTGHMEPASFRVLESTNPGFNAAAEETLQKSVFRPARVKGVPVRQRTVQAVVFKITQS